MNNLQIISSTKEFYFKFCQENEQYNNKKGILRGLHYQIEPHAQAKLIHVAKGKVLNIAVDIRKNSKNFGKHISIELEENSKKYIFIPKGYAHGYITLSNKSILIYKVNEYFYDEFMKGIAYDDKYLNIDWRFSQNDIIVSDRDSKNPKFKDILSYKGSV